jgi:hypothetical protein
MRTKKTTKKRPLRVARAKNGHLRKCIADLLDMLNEWDCQDGMSGFAGFYAVKQAERAIGREETQAS